VGNEAEFFFATVVSANSRALRGQSLGVATLGCVCDVAGIVQLVPHHRQSGGLGRPSEIA
jgi:hypothetical protein